MSISIVIPIYNQHQFTDNCLKNLAKLSTVDNQIIVFDNGSDENTQAIMKKHCNLMKNLIHLRSDKNLGFGAAVNKGISRSDGDVVMILNNDLKFSHMTEDQIAGWTNRFLNLQPGKFAGPTVALIDRQFNFKYETHDFKKPHNYLSGWCMAGHRETWEAMKVEGCDSAFDTNNFFVYFEDTDLGFRCLRDGVEFIDMQVEPIHIGKMTSSKMNLNKMYMNSKRKFIKKWKNNYQITGEK